MYRLRIKKTSITSSISDVSVTQILLEKHFEKTIELKISYMKLKTAIIEYTKYYDDQIECPKIHYSVFDNTVYNSVESVDVIRESIKEIEVHLKSISRLFCKVFVYSDVAFRKKYGVLHTIPQSKIELFEKFVPNICRDIIKSRNNASIKKKEVFNVDHRKMKVRFVC